MRDLILATILFALMTIYLAIYSWNKPKKAEENNQNLSEEERSLLGVAASGMSIGFALTSKLSNRATRKENNQCGKDWGYCVNL